MTVTTAWTPARQAVFWSKVEKAEACWVWRGGVHKSALMGYGYFGKPKKLAHRLSFELTNGPIPAGLCVLHRCDVRACVNPAHLFLGTRADNTADMMAKGRHRPCGRHRKMTRALAAQIRAEYLRGGTSHPKLAARFGFHRGTIQALLSGKRWR